MWIHQSGDMYECSNCGLIEHIKPLWTRCPICGEPGKAEKHKTIDDPHVLADEIMKQRRRCRIDPGYIKADASRQKKNGGPTRKSYSRKPYAYVKRRRREDDQVDHVGDCAGGREVRRAADREAVCNGDLLGAHSVVRTRRYGGTKRWELY